MTRITTKTDDDKHTRYLQLQEWVTAALSAGKLQTGRQVTLDAISGDAGFRRYYRLAGSTPALLAVDAPPETEKNHAFCHIAQLFRQYGIHAPQVYAVDYTRGFMLIEDMGDLVYWPLLTGQSHHALYDDAAQCLLKMQSIPCLQRLSVHGIRLPKLLMALIRKISIATAGAVINAPIINTARISFFGSGCRSRLK